MPINFGKPDSVIRFPLEPSVQGRRHNTAQAGDAFISNPLKLYWTRLKLAYAELFSGKKHEAKRVFTQE
jgi:hypothetical protein